MQRRQVDFKGGDPGTTKNRDGRVFPLVAELRVLLEAQHELTTLNASAGSQGGVPGCTPHDLHRTAVRNFEQKGISRSVAMKLTGHKTESVYRRYAVVSESDLAEAVRRLDSATGTISATIAPKSGESS